LAAGLFLWFVVILLSGCARTTSVTQPSVKPEAIPQNAQSTEKPAVASDLRSISGKVVETMNAGSYTYVNVEKDGKKFWAAIPVTKVSVGQEIEVRSGIIMGKFTSNYLKRTFDDIVFSPGLVTDTKESLPTTPLASGAKISLPPGHRPVDVKSQVDQGQTVMAAVSGKVVETLDSGGYTYLCLESGGKKIWAAVPTMNASIGQELILQPGQEMFNFKSKSLNRTFDSVIFSAGPLPAMK
jgi:starvation-inducible outer membrane lipoprotein